MLRERYERIVSERFGISLEAFRAKKVAAPEPKRLKKPNIDVKASPAISRAEKDLAAILSSGKVVLDDFEPLDFNKDELALIFEERYEKLTAADLEREANELFVKVRKERRELERKTIEAQIQEAESANDEAKIQELMQQLSKMLREK